MRLSNYSDKNQQQHFFLYQEAKVLRACEKNIKKIEEQVSRTFLLIHSLYTQRQRDFVKSREAKEGQRSLSILTR